MRPIAFIIEDDPTLAIVFSKALEEAEFTTRVIMDGGSALHELSTETPHLVLLDLHLPHVDGTQLLEYIEGAPHLQQTRVVVASADAELARQLTGRVAMVLEKPVSFHQLRLLSSRLR